MAGRTPCRIPPAAFDLHAGATRATSSARHYVGTPGIRPRFFTEGVPMLLRDAAERGQVPADFAI